MKTKPARKGYLLSRSKASGGYAHIHMRFVQPMRYSAERPESRQLCLRWQANDRPGDFSEWYGLHAELDCTLVWASLTCP